MSSLSHSYKLNSRNNEPLSFLQDSQDSKKVIIILEIIANCWVATSKKLFCLHNLIRLGLSCMVIGVSWKIWWFLLTIPSFLSDLFKEVTLQIEPLISLETWSHMRPEIVTSGLIWDQWSPCFLRVRQSVEIKNIY